MRESESGVFRLTASGLRASVVRGDPVARLCYTQTHRQLAEPRRTNGGDVNRILGFDVGRVLRFDVNRILQWDVGRALRWHIPTILLKALAGWFVGGLLLAMIVPMAVRRGWHLNEWTGLIVILGSMAIFCASDLVRVLRGHRSPP
jgi:hypothetical protein